MRKHGLIRDLKICRDVFAERNELQDDTSTLAELGECSCRSVHDDCCFRVGKMSLLPFAVGGRV